MYLSKIEYLGSNVVNVLVFLTSLNLCFLLNYIYSKSIFLIFHPSVAKPKKPIKSAFVE